MNITQDKNIQEKIQQFAPLFGSVIVHAFIFLYLGTLSYQDSPLSPQMNSLVLEEIDQASLDKIRQKYKQVGDENGSDQTILKTEGIPNLSPNAKPELKELKSAPPTITQKREMKASKNKVQIISLADLQAQKASILIEPHIEKKKILKHSENLNDSSVLSVKGNEIRQQALTKDSEAALYAPDPLINNSSFSLKLELPKGVKAEDLNAEELQYYSFQKRTLLSYISSFYHALRKHRLERPHIEIAKAREEHLMTGKVTFDTKGHVRKIRVIRYTDREEAQDFFIKVLEGITVPNPPIRLINDQEEFAFYFTLILKG